MPSFNKVMLIGNLTRDPVLRTTSSGFSICEFGIAVSRKYRSQQGEEKSETCFIDINFMGKQADVCNRYLHKGDPLYIEGRLKYDSWTDKTTQKQRSRLLVVGENMQFLGGPNRQGGPQTSVAPQGGAYPPPAFGGAAPAPQQPSQPQAQAQAYPPPAFGGVAPGPQQPPARGFAPPMPPPPPMGGGDAGAGGEDFYEDLPF